MTPETRLEKLKQLKQYRAIVSSLESELKAGTTPRTNPKKPKPKGDNFASSKVEKEVEEVSDLIISNRVARESDNPITFTSTSTAKML